MPDHRVTVAPLALLLLLATPTYGQAPGDAPPGASPGWHRGQDQAGQGQVQDQQGQHRPSRDHQTHAQTPPVTQPQTSQGQPTQGQTGPWRQHRAQQGQPPLSQTPPVIQNQPPVQQSQGRRQGSDQPRRRDNPAIQVYRGPDNYRPGSPPPTAQWRNQQARNRDIYRQTWRAERRYHLRPYLRPQGWYLRDWILGDVLPSIFWSHNYWIVDYWRYGLPIPPDGCVWVRYDHDALLVDRYSGEVVQVIYDIFY
jgi:hypothetical protein